VTQEDRDRLARGDAGAALRRAVEFDQVVAGLAASLIRVPAGTIDAQIVQALGTLGELLGADRAGVVQVDPIQKTLVRTHLWVRTGTKPPPPFDALGAFPWLTVRLWEARELVALTRLDELPPEAARDRASLERNGVVSGALAPMVVEDRVVGQLMFATVEREQQWSSDLVARLRLVGETIASALARRDAETALRAALSENESLRERLAAENVYLQAELVEARDFGEIVGQTAVLRAALEKVRQVADTTAPVLLLGETGTGKELLARALHSHSRRRARSFVAVNCAALPAALVESELFGYDKGAFTGASQSKPGRFELADQGTLLLDEIGELEPALQAKLLRVLEDGEIQRLGSTATRKVDVRVIAATNRDLRRDARDGRFRPDLYYRLSVFPIEVAPLRDRREDIPLLVWHFVQTRQRELGRTIRKIPRAAMAALQAYEWPGNVRELHNVIERAIILSEGSVLRVEEAFGPTLPERDPRDSRPTEALRDVERAHIVQVLDRCQWTIEGRGQAAQRLGLNPSTLRNRMRKLGITRPAR
jgi:transcriptional regulator with GAF, ATPase, and Fis domain